MLYGRFIESNQAEIQLPDHDEDTMRAFINWTYTGNIRTCHPTIGDPYLDERNALPIDEIPERTAERLWILGDKLLACDFTNAAMELVGRRYHQSIPQAMVADYVYDNTLPGSKLRLFWKQLVRTEGPLLRHSEHNIYSSGDIEVEWATVLVKGGDLVTDCLAGFLIDELSSCHRDTPYLNGNLRKYMNATEPTSATDWIKAKKDKNDQSGHLAESSKRKFEQ